MGEKGGGVTITTRPGTRKGLGPLESQMVKCEGAGLAFLGLAQGTQVGAQLGPRAQAWCLSASLVVFGEVFLAVFHVGLDCVTAWLPASGTDCEKTQGCTGEATAPYSR